MQNSSSIGPSIHVPASHGVEKTLKEDGLKSSPPPGKVQAMHNETTALTIRRELGEKRQKTTIKIRSAEIYQAAEAMDRLAGHIENLAQDAKNLLSTKKQDEAQKSHEKILGDLKDIQDELHAPRSIPPADKTSEAEPLPPKQVYRSSHPAGVGLDNHIEKLRSRIASKQSGMARALGKDLKKESQSLTVNPLDSGTSSDTDKLIQTMASHVVQLQKIDQNLQGLAAGVIQKVAEDIDSEPNPDLPNIPAAAKSLLDRTI
jgi:hypothetical protein